MCCRFESFGISSVTDQGSSRRVSNDNTQVELAFAFALWVSIAQWLQRLTGHHIAAGSFPVQSSRIVFLISVLDERLSIIQPTFVGYTEVHDSSWAVQVPELVLPVHHRLHMVNDFVNNVFSSCQNSLLVLANFRLNVCQIVMVA